MEQSNAIQEEEKENKIEEKQEEIFEIEKQISLPYTQEEIKKSIEKQKEIYSNLLKSIQNEEKINLENQKKILVNWRKVVAEMKKEEIKEEFKKLANCCQRQLDLKTVFLQTLQERFEETNQQYQLTLKNHILHVDKFDELRRIKISQVKENFEENLKLIYEEFEKEYNEIMEERVKQLKYLSDMIDQIKDDEKQKSNIINENFQQLQEEIKDKTTEEMDLMQTEMNTKKVNIYTALENLFQNFMNESKDKFKVYTNLMEENSKQSKSIEETIKKISKTKNKIKLTSLKILQMKKEFEHKNSKIKKENDEIAKNFLELKNKMFRFRSKERKKLTVLVCNTKLATEKLKEIHELGERILKKTQLCRKMEFENEKVSPFYQNLSEKENENQKLEIEEFFTQQQLGKYSKFQNYFKRYNKILLDKIAIELEKEKLKNVNKNLKTQLLKYMDGLTVTKYVLENEKNNLLTTVPKPLYREKENTFQGFLEGAHEMQRVYQYNKQI